MDERRLQRLMSELGVSPAGKITLNGALSRAHVVPVVQFADTPAVLELTSKSSAAREAAERELRFYRECQPLVGIATPRLVAHAEDDDVIALVLTRHPGSRPAAGGATRTGCSWPATSPSCMKLPSVPSRAGAAPRP